jgi:TetR/AcrR family transcriptional regulator, transcriptional repressor for nem operon
MARTKAFDPDAALERAMQAFWTRGYAATSTQDLVDALGINRSSLYGTFHSKDELYRRALQLYTEVDEPWSKALVEGSGPFRERLREALLAAVADDLDPDRSRGCFIGNAAVERAAVDERVRRLVAAGFGNVRGVFAAALVRARDDGELPAGADIEARATLLLTTFEGLRVMAKGARDRAQIEQAVDAVVATF